MPSEGTLEGSGQHVPQRPINVTFNGTELSHPAFEEFGLGIDRFDREQQFELWLLTNDGPAIAMLRNGEHAFLMYLRFKGDSGFVTMGDRGKQGTCAYRLGNGQIDELPLSWCIDLDQCYRAIAYFFVNDGVRYNYVATRQPYGFGGHRSDRSAAQSGWPPGLGHSS
jgi:hypothetical protein